MVNIKRGNFMDTLKIGEILVKKQFCTPEQIKHALDIQRILQFKTKIGEILLNLSYINTEQLQKALSEQLKESFTLQSSRKI